MQHGWLIPAQDRKQQLRTMRTLQAIGGGLIQSLVALFIFLAGGFSLSGGGFAVLLIGLWVGHAVFYLLIRLGYNQRFGDPSMTQAQVVWAIVCTLLLLLFMTRFRALMLPFLYLVLIFGAFKMTTRQYIVMAVLIVVGYGLVIGLAGSRSPRAMPPDVEIMRAAVFVLTILVFSLVGIEISRLRRKLHRRNTDLAEAMQKMARMAITDELTGLINRRQMMFVLDQQKAQADRGGTPFCVCYMDIDHFKSVNDTLGHAVGDVVLKRFAATTQNALRRADLFARFGGEEFVLLACGTHVDGAAIAANRIRHTIGCIDFSDVAPGLRVTLSAGVAQFRPKEAIHALLARADKALYLAKNSGRNCVKLKTAADGGYFILTSR